MILGVEGEVVVQRSYSPRKWYHFWPLQQMQTKNTPSEEERYADQTKHRVLPRYLG
jgi:hypothetical protein